MADAPPPVVVPPTGAAPAGDGREGRPPAVLPPLEPPAPPVTNTSEAYTGRFRLSPRYVITPALPAKPLISVPINMEALRAQFLILFQAAFVQWNVLRNMYSGNPVAVTADINLGCENLASATCLMIYNLLRYKCSVHDSQNQNIYRTRCHFDMGTEMPHGVAFLVELFGFADPSDAHFNPTFIHRWDHQEHADNRFGLTVAHALNTHILVGFLNRLSSAGVPFRRIDKYCAPRNLWDSLHIVEVDLGFDVFTTYPIANYVLPRDVFLAIGIASASSLVANRAIMFYPPRICRFDGQNANIRIKASEPVDATDAERAAMPALGATDHATDAQLRVNNSLVDMHLTGTQRRLTGIDAANGNAPIYAESVWIYGRGGAQACMRIDCVARGVTPEEVYGYFRALLRHG